MKGRGPGASHILIRGDARRLPLADGSVDAVICDPPYPEISRPYGRMTEEAWHSMMRLVVAECRRVLKPSGSAVFVLQPNSEKVGRMRPWMFEFQAWTAREWNMVQDVSWWNPSAPPTIHSRRNVGLMRPSVKACVWLGEPNCYRDQDSILWTAAEWLASAKREDRALRRMPCGNGVREGRIAQACDERGGVTPFNLIPICNANSTDSAGTYGHGAGTPLDLCDWWVKYITSPGDLVVDPFAGSGTVGRSSVHHGRRFVGLDLMADYTAMQQICLARAERPHEGDPIGPRYAGLPGQLSFLEDMP